MLLQATELLEVAARRCPKPDLESGFAQRPSGPAAAPTPPSPSAPRLPRPAATGRPPCLLADSWHWEPVAAAASRRSSRRQRKRRKRRRPRSPRPWRGHRRAGGKASCAGSQRAYSEPGATVSRSSRAPPAALPRSRAGPAMHLEPAVPLSAALLRAAAGGLQAPVPPLVRLCWTTMAPRRPHRPQPPMASQSARVHAPA